ncbi:hypothetical protein NFI95_00095 [Acetobacteraceae bacterium KSS8]|uniref:Lectin-like protein BA14k n=1 Tax=Endosaccharibacter trunci TaxID=2812733 RepID=A0ABT1W1V2_9PROT|nr:hypothetical protein [Acetobacteraceae bacterium KSS8]
MERWLTATRRIAPTVTSIVTSLALAGALSACADDVQPPPAAGTAATAAQPPSPPPARAPVTATSGPATPGADTSGADTASADASTAGVLPNDPSAPTNTPLCGIAAQENNAMTRQLMPRQYAEAGQCTAYACYDVATATYIGADGFRHVCR